MPAIDSIWVEIGARIDGFLKGMSDVSARLRSTISDAEKQFAGFELLGNRLTSLGASLAAAVTVPIAAIGIGSAKAFGDFDAALTKSLAIQGDVSASMRTTMANAAIELSKHLSITATQGAQSFYYLGSAGLSAEEQLKALPIAARFAQAGMVDMEKSAQLLTQTQAALGLNVGSTTDKMREMTRISDVLVQADKSANGSAQQFAEALANKGAAALKIYNKSLEEGVAVLEAYATVGIRGAIAGNYLSIAMRDLQGQAIKHSAAFKELGIRVYDSAGKMRNMADIIKDFEVALKGASDEQTKMAFKMLGLQDRSQFAILPLIGLSGAIRNYEADLKKAGGATEDVANRQMQTFNKQVELAWNRVTAMAISIGGSLVPTIQKLGQDLEPVLTAVENAVKWFTKLPVPVQEGAFAIAALTAATPLAIIALGQLAKSVTAVVEVYKLLTSVELAKSLLGLADGATIASKAFTLLGTAMRAIPYVALAAGIVYAGSKLLEYGHGTDTAAKATDELNKKWREQQIATGQVIDPMRRLMNDVFAVGDANEKAAPKVKDHANEQGGLASKLGATATAFRYATMDQLLNEEAHRKNTTAVQGAVATIAKWLEAAQPWGEKIKLVASDTEGLATATNLYRASLDQLVNPVIHMVEVGDKWHDTIYETSKIMSGVGLKSSLDLRKSADDLNKVYERTIQLNLEGKATYLDVQRTQLAALKARIEANHSASAEEIKQLHDLENATGSVVTNIQSRWTTLGKEISQTMRQLSGQIASAIVEWKGLGDVAVKIGQDIAKAILKFIIEQGLAQLVIALSGVMAHLGSLGKALEDWAHKVTGTLNAATTAATKIGTAAAGAAAKVGGVITGSGEGPETSGLSGIGTSGDWGGETNSPDIMGGATGAGGSGTSQVGQVAGQVVGSTVTGIVGAVAGVVGAISSVIGNFQMAHMNTALGRIEESTRKLWIVTGEQGAESIQGLIKDIRNTSLQMNDRLVQIINSGLGVYNAAGDQGLRIAGAVNGGSNNTTIINHFEITSDDPEEMAQKIARILKLQSPVFN